MRQLRDYRMAMLAAIVSLVVAMPGLPLAAFPIWALMVLYRPDVRAAFHDVALQRAPEPAAKAASPSPASVPRPGVGWVTVAGVAAVSLLVIGLALLAVYEAKPRGRFTPTAQESREMIRLQRQFEDAVSPSRLAALGQNPTERRAAARIELENQLRKLFGDERYAEYLQEEIRAGRRLRR